MTLGAFSPESQDPIRRADLRKRAFNVTVKAQKALASGAIRLPPNTQAMLQAELADIRKALVTPPPPGDSYSCVSSLPLAWLQARWNTVCQPIGGWYPGFSQEMETHQSGAMLKTTHRYSVRYFSAAGARRVLESWTSPLDLGDKWKWLATPFLTHAALTLDGAWGQSVLRHLDDRLPPLAKPSADVRGVLQRLQPRPDPLLLFSWVRAARVKVLSLIYYSVLGKHKDKDEASLLHEGERLKLGMEVAFEQAGRQTRMRVHGLDWVDLHSAATLLEVQRLCVLLLAIVYGRSLGETDQSALSYIDVEERLQARGLSDLPPGGEDAQRRQAWETVRAALAAAAAKGRWAPIPTEDGSGVEAWVEPRKQLRIAVPPGTDDVVIAVQDLSLATIPYVTTVYANQACRPADSVRLIADRTDGPSVRYLVWQVQTNPKRVELDFLGPDTWSESWLFDDTVDAPDSPLGLGPGLFKRLQIPYPKHHAADPVLGLTPTMGILDPVLSLAWLGLQHLKHLVHGSAGASDTSPAALKRALESLK